MTEKRESARIYDFAKAVAVSVTLAAMRGGMKAFGGGENVDVTGVRTERSYTRRKGVQPPRPEAGVRTTPRGEIRIVK